MFDGITFFDDIRITLYFDIFESRMEITLQLCFTFARHCDIFSLRCNYVIYLFDIVTFFDSIRITLYFGTFELRLEITLQLRYVFAHHCDIILLRHNGKVLLRHNYVIYLFDVVTFFDNLRITLYFGTFELRLEITLQLRYVFARHSDVILLCHNDKVLLRHNYVIYLFDVVTFFDNVRITLYFGTFELRMEITLQLRFVFARHCDVFFITSQLRYLFVLCSYVF